MTDHVEIRVVPYDDPDAQKLVAAALADLGERYGGNGDDTPVAVADFVSPAGQFLVGYLDGEPVGSAAWRTRGDVAELKRMFTMPHARGRGLARRLLAAAEESARAHGRRRMILECGDRQPEAIALYTNCGYDRIENYGHYRDHEGTISFGRAL